VEDCLLNGTFDEDQSHKYFMEALLEFRGGKEAVQDTNVKSVRFDENTNFDAKTIRKKGNTHLYSIRYNEKSSK
jgi:hypothetical protein